MEKLTHPAAFLCFRHIDDRQHSLLLGSRHDFLTDRRGAGSWKTSLLHAIKGARRDSNPRPATPSLALHGATILFTIVERERGDTVCCGSLDPLLSTSVTRRPQQGLRSIRARGAVHRATSAARSAVPGVGNRWAGCLLDGLKLSD